MKETKFKDTEIGRIPEEWEEFPLSSLVTDIADGPFGSNLKTEHYISKKQVRVVQLSNIGDDGWHDANTKYTSFAHASTLSRCIIPTGSVLIAKMMPAGRAIICPNIDNSYILGSDVVRITCNTKLEPKYFVYSTKSKLYLEQISECTQGSTRQRTSISKLKNIQIVVPPFQEQCRIASALTSIDNLISSLGKLIEKKKNIKQGAMQQLLTGRTRLKGFSEPWVEKKLGELFEIGNGKDYKNLKSGPIPVFGTGGLMTYVNEYLYDGETICIGRKETIDKPQYHKGKIWTVDTLFYTYRFKDINVKYLYYLSTTINWNEYNTATGVPSLTSQNILKIKVVLPLEEEQQAIATILTKMDDEITALEAKKAKYEAIKQGMMQQLLTGKIRLIS